jgi:anthranilate/para-aminobenzoate synthase component II
MVIMNKGKIGKTLKAAVPTLILTGVGVSFGHQFIMILAGAAMTLEHRLMHGRWWDKDKQICHGKFGIASLMAGCCVTLVGIL